MPVNLKAVPGGKNRTEVRSMPLTDEEIAARAWRATRAMRRELPRLTVAARAMTGRDVVVDITNGTPCTDGKTIWLRPNIELGDELVHVNLSQCLPLRTPDYVPICEACAAHEEVLITLIHEIGHIAYGSFDSVSERDAKELIAKMAEEAQAAGVADGLAGLASGNATGADPQSYMAAADLINPFLGTILNAWEDAAVNKQTIDARPGTYAMFRHSTNVIFEKGLQRNDGTWQRWDEAHPDMQAIIGIFCRASGYDTDGWFVQRVEEFLNSPEVAKLLWAFKTARSAKARYRLCFPTLELLRSNGYCLRAGEQVTMTGGITAAGQESQPGQGAQGSEPQPGDTATKDSGADSSEDADADGSEKGDSGSGSDKGLDKSQDTDDDESADDDAEGAGQDGSSEDPDVDKSMDAGAGSDADADAADAADAADDADADESMKGSGASSPLDGYHNDDSWMDDDDSPADHGDSDLGDDPFDDSDDESSDGGPGDADSDSDDSDDADSDDFSQGEPQSGSDGTPNGQAADGYSDPDEVARGLRVFGGHLPPSSQRPSSQELREEAAIRREIDRAVMQEPLFDEPTFAITDIRVTKDFDGTQFRSYDLDTDDIKVPDGELATALLHMRIAFADNARGRKTVDLKRGRINGRALARRVPVNDDRLFFKKTAPGRRDYFVVIGLDISGSTSGEMIKHIKRAGLAQAELCHRMGIDFAVYAHAGSSRLDIWEVKAPNEPWSEVQRKRLLVLGSLGTNRDGFTLEYYRKIADKSTATDKIIMYYTDGALNVGSGSPQDEQYRVLQRELNNCKNRGYMMVAVAFDEDDPVRYGIDTILVHTDDETQSVPRVVVQGLKDRLITKARQAS